VATLAAAGVAAISPTDVRAVARGNNTFACDLYGQLRQNDGNIAISPFSVSAALAMTSLGARGRTAEEMRDTLHQPAVDELHAITGGLATGLQSSKTYELRLLNTLWLQTGTKVRPEFAADLRKHYHAVPAEVDFSDGELARKTMNAGVSESCGDRVRAVVPAGALIPQTHSAVTSVAYFRSGWAAPFRKDMTQLEEFAVAPDKRVRVPMMHQAAAYPYLDAAKYQAVEMPYAGERMAMVILLPKPGVTLTEVEKGLTPDQLTDLAAALAPEKIMMRLPRFKIGAPVCLDGALQKLGMAAAFTSDADLSGLNGGGPLALGPVLHQATITVDEDGSDALPLMVPTAAKSLAPDKGAEFVADHPFVVVLVERASRTILFMGRVADPG